MKANLSNLNLNGIKDFFAKSMKNLSWLFLAILFILLVFEFFEIQNSINIIVNINQEPVAVNTPKGVRINFDTYGEVVKRIQDAVAFVPTGGVTKDPFNPDAGTIISPQPNTPSTSTTTPPDTGGAFQLP